MFQQTGHILTLWFPVFFCYFIFIFTSVVKEKHDVWFRDLHLQVGLLTQRGHVCELWCFNWKHQSAVCTDLCAFKNYFLTWNSIKHKNPCPHLCVQQQRWVFFVFTQTFDISVNEFYLLHLQIRFEILSKVKLCVAFFYLYTLKDYLLNFKLQTTTLDEP